MGFSFAVLHSHYYNMDNSQLFKMFQNLTETVAEMSQKMDTMNKHMEELQKSNDWYVFCADKLWQVCYSIASLNLFQKWMKSLRKKNPLRQIFRPIHSTTENQMLLEENEVCFKKKISAFLSDLRSGL